MKVKRLFWVLLLLHVSYKNIVYIQRKKWASLQVNCPIENQIEEVVNRKQDQTPIVYWYNTGRPKKSAPRNNDFLKYENNNI